MWPFKRKRSQVPTVYRPADGPIDLPPQTPDTPVPFGYKTIWWAVPSIETQVVADAIQLHDQQPVNWKTGVEYAYQRSIFVSPPVRGWTLIAGCYLPPGGDSLFAEVQAGLKKLSRQFHDTQVFSTHRIVDYHVWAKAEDGKVIRAFGYLGESGELLGVYGEPTVVEQDMGYSYIDDPDTSQDDVSITEVESEDIDYPTEEHVMEVARGWSVCPCDLDEIEDVSASLGILGSRSELLAHTS